MGVNRRLGVILYGAVVIVSAVCSDVKIFAFADTMYICFWSLTVNNDVFLYSFNRSVFVIETQIFCDVGTEPCNIIYINFRVDRVFVIIFSTIIVF